MAHGFRCVNCGCQEASHQYPKDYPEACNSYQSPDENLEEKIWAYERQRECAGPISPQIWLVTPSGNLIDIGS